MPGFMAAEAAYLEGLEERMAADPPAYLELNAPDPEGPRPPACRECGAPGLAPCAPTCTSRELGPSGGG